MTLHYPIKLDPDDNGTWLVTCPALPEVTTFGEDEEDAKRHAAHAIEEALAARIGDGTEIPRPRQQCHGMPPKGKTRTKLGCIHRRD
jgi:predicted RNase H-like HicB family nuclease